MIGLEERIAKIIERQEDMLGNAGHGRAYTATLHVSPDGTGADGLSWRTAYTTIQAALDAASTDANELTLILIAPQTGANHYDIATAGDPSWSANVILKGSHRNWAKIQNDTGDSIMTLTGLAAVIDCNFNLGTGTNGLKLTHGGGRVYSCQFIGEDLTSAKTALHLDHSSGGKHAKVIDIDFLGDASPGTQMTAILIDQWGYSNFERIRIHQCLTGIQFVGAASDKNIFNKVDIGECAIGLDIDAGNEQHFHDIIFHQNTRNVDSEVQDQIWKNMYGAFPIYITPDNFMGTAVACGGAGNTYGGDTELIATNAIDNPFRIVGVNFAPDASPAEWYMVRFSADSGSTWYDVLMFLGDKREGIAAPSGTEFIFNADTRISCSAKSESGGNNVDIWVEVQEI